MEMDIKEVLLNRIDIKGLLVEDLLGGIIFAKLDALVLESDNTLDDALVAMLKPELKKALDDVLSKEIDKIIAK